jgi:hypothetical protein
MEQQIHQARMEYLSAAISEINDVCNAVENGRDDLIETLREKAMASAQVAQEKFDVFAQLVNTHKANKDNES